LKKNKPHIVHLIASTGMYGAEKWILALMRAMEGGRIRSTIINFVDSPRQVSTIVEVAQSKGLEALDVYTGGTYNPSVFLRLSKWLKENQVDIVHGHGYKSDLIGLVAAKINGIKVVVTPHGWSKEQDWKLNLYERIDRLIFRFVDYVCPLSQELLESIRSHARPEKIKLILNGVDIDEVREQSGIALSVREGLRIGYIGQLIERKDVSTLINALKLLPSIKNGVKVIIVGNGPERNRLEGLAKDLNLLDKIEFLGYRKDALAVLKSFDVFVLPSLLEGIPRCVMEAMAAQIPVVASDIPGSRDLIKNGTTGLLFPPGDAESLAEILLDLESNREKLLDITSNAYDFIIENHSNERMASQYSVLYSQLLGGQ
jgi:glycosyltransferase involved in cell wall biosynthesis